MLNHQYTTKNISHRKKKVQSRKVVYEEVGKDREQERVREMSYGLNIASSNY